MRIISKSIADSQYFFQITHFTYILGELSISEFSDPYLITQLLKMSNCLLSQKVLQIASISQITHSPTFWRYFTC